MVFLFQMAARSRTPMLSSAASLSPSLRLAEEWARCEEAEEEETSEAQEEESHIGIQQSSSGKWYGQVNDTAHAALKEASGSKRKSKRKMRVTPHFATRSEAVKALAQLKAQIKQEYEAIILPRVQADFLVKDLPRAPVDPSTAVRNKAYWVCNSNTKFLPKRMVVVKQGKKRIGWGQACIHCPIDNSKQANMDKRVVATQPSCIAHGGVCKHGRYPGHCRGCQEDNPGNQMLRLCNHCQKNGLYRKRQTTAGGNGLCAACETYLKQQAAEAGAEPPPKGKKWEDVVLDELVTMVTDTSGNVIAYEMRDDLSNMLGSNKRRRKGECSTEHQRRPDILWLVRDSESHIVAAVMVEIDEDSHTTRDSVCEGGKVDETFQSILKLAQEEGKGRLAETRRGEVLTPQVFFIRFNPNACDAPGGPIQLSTRIKVLAARVRELLHTPAEVYQQRSREEQCMKPYLEILYYHSKQGGKHLAFYEEHKEAFHLTPNRCPRGVGV